MNGDHGNLTQRYTQSHFVFGGVELMRLQRRLRPRFLPWLQREVLDPCVEPGRLGSEEDLEQLKETLLLPLQMNDLAQIRV